jgi:hypothetical protein
MTRFMPFLLVLLMQGAQAQELGRLFFTPEQREALDARRRARVPDKPAAAPVVASPVTRVDGYVKRSTGPSTVWVDGEALTDTAPDGGRVPVNGGEGGARARLKPGESLDRGNGAVRDVIGDGEIRVQRAE